MSMSATGLSITSFLGDHLNAHIASIAMEYFSLDPRFDPRGFALLARSRR
jgi:hypothetical protein